MKGEKNDKKKNDITQERASYVDENKNFMDGQFTFNFPKRNEEEFGTDLFIIGLKNFGKLKERIILSTINNFLLSIFNNDLEIIVQNFRLNAGNLKDVLDKLDSSDMNKTERSLFDSTLRYYDVITNENTLSFKLDNRFEKYDFIERPEDGLLRILNHEPANRTILQTRQAGMKIYDRNRISGNINFSGIFQATGEKFNAFLKDMENANHDRWSPDRFNGATKKTAENLLSDLLQWYKQVVKESYEQESEKEIEAFGVNDLLPIQDNNQEGKNKKDSGIRNKISNISISKRKDTIQIKDGDKEGERLENIIDLVENGPGNSSGSGSNRHGKSGGENPSNHNGVGEDYGEYGGEGSETVGEAKKLIERFNAIRLKIIDIDSSKGLYRIVCIPTKSMKKMMVELKYVGADGKSYSIKLLNVSSSSIQTELVNNNLQISSVKKNQNFNIDFETKSNLRMKMEAYVYEIKG